MKGNRRTDTQPEQMIRSLLHKVGVRFRKDRLIRAQDVRVKADIVFGSDRLVVFVDGCFWHGCPEHGRTPKVNTHYWGPKLDRNARRDRRVTAALEADGWHVLRFWEHVPAEHAAATIIKALDDRRARRDVAKSAPTGSDTASTR